MKGASFWDTNLLIYWLEQPDAWAAPIQRLRTWHQERNLRIVTCALTLAEILVHPISRDRPDVANAYKSLITEMGCLIFGPEEAWAFAEIRAAHPALRPPDCIQLACARVFGVTYFFTNDEALQKVHIEGIQQIAYFRAWSESDRL
jgi:predicted nucleic acid-binding protein